MKGRSGRNLRRTHINILAFLISSVPHSITQPPTSHRRTTHASNPTPLFIASRAPREPAFTSASRNRLPGFTRSPRRRWTCSRCGTSLETWVLTCDTIATAHLTTPPLDSTDYCYGGDSRCASLFTKGRAGEGEGMREGKHIKEWKKKGK